MTTPRLGKEAGPCTVHESASLSLQLGQLTFQRDNFFIMALCCCFCCVFGRHVGFFRLNLSFLHGLCLRRQCTVALHQLLNVTASCLKRIHSLL